MTRPRPDKKRESSKPDSIKILLMQLRVADRLTDETGEREVIGRPFASAAGKNAHARVRKIGQPETTDLRTWARTSTSK